MLKKKWIVLLGAITILLIVAAALAPFIVDWLYLKNPPAKFFDVTIGSGDILNYYGAFLSFLATVILGCIAIYQTYNAQRKADEINKLQLRIMQKEASIAERKYEQEQTKLAEQYEPKFEIKLKSYNGYYSNINLSMKNTSSFMVTDLCFIDFCVYGEAGDKKLSVSNYQMKFKSLGKGEQKQLLIKSPNMYEQHQHGSSTLWKNVILEFKFSCEDEKGSLHYMKATLSVESTNKFNGDYWKVKKVA